MTVRPVTRILRARLCRFYSTPPPASNAPGAPPLLRKLRSDLKDAMRAKDTNRLSVLRSILAEVTNLSKTNSPIKKDIQLLALLRKRASAAEIAADEFKTHQRLDLAEKEDIQGKILAEYAGQVEVVSEAEIRRAVENVVRGLRSGGGRVDVGVVLRTVLGEGGDLGAKPVDRGDVARVVKDLISTRG